MPLKESFAPLLDQVKRAPNAKEGAMRLLQGIGQRFQSAKDDPGKVQEIADELSTGASGIVDAIVSRLPASEQQGQGGQGPESATATATSRSVPGAAVPASQEKQPASGKHK